MNNNNNNNNKKGGWIIPLEQLVSAIAALKELQGKESTDTEQNHIDADAILMNLLPIEVVEEYDKIHKWYA